MVACSQVLIPIAPMGWVYAISAVALGALFLVMAYRLHAAIVTDANVERQAMRVFHGSISYLALLFLAVAIDPFVG